MSSVRRDLEEDILGVQPLQVRRMPDVLEAIHRGPPAQLPLVHELPSSFRGAGKDTTMRDQCIAADVVNPDD